MYAIKNEAGATVQPPTRMVDVAVAAGVSVTTVSNVLHRPGIVAPRTREKVQVAIRALNYEIDQQRTVSSRKMEGRHPQKPSVTEQRRPGPRAPKPVTHITPYFTLIQAAQVRAAHQAAGFSEGYASLSDLVVAATMQEVKRLQLKYNEGREWKGLAAGVIRQGRPNLGAVATRDPGASLERTP